MASFWRHYPWVLGLVLAPLLFGSVNPEGQAVVGLLFSLSLILLAPDMGGNRPKGLRLVITCLACFLLALPLLPLPEALIHFVSPARAALERNFPVDAESPRTWFTFCLSPANYIQRLWELGLIAACFALARQSARIPASGNRLGGALAVALCLLVLADVWCRSHGRQSILGLWQVSWGYGAGTFANRNHFAHWVYVTALFVVGGVLRGLWPFQSARKKPHIPAKRDRFVALTLAGVMVAGLVSAVISGSRGGLLAGLAGTLVWLWHLGARTRNRQRWSLVAFGALGLFLVLWNVSGFLWQRLSEIDTGFLARYGKTGIWIEAGRLAWKFPLLGVGWGGFALGHSHFKQAGAGVSCLHVENDYIQLLSETGLVGAVCFGSLLWGWLRLGLSGSRASRLSEPEWIFGAVAALAAFLTGAIYEFVFQVTANALLGAALLGWLVGSAETAGGPAVPPLPGRVRVGANLALGLGLSLLAVLQGLSFWHWHRARTEQNPIVVMQAIEASLKFWPWASSRQIALTRQQVLMAGAEAEQPQLEYMKKSRAQLTRAIARDPFNWELRLERAWLDLAFFPDNPRSVAEAREVARLNPTQPQIPLRFARHFARLKPDLAHEFLGVAVASSPASLKEALTIAWGSDREPARLWLLTPDTAESLLVLGDFALDQGLKSLAAQAYLMTTNRVDPRSLGMRLLKAGRPEAVLLLLDGLEADSAVKAVLAEAHFQTGRYDEVLKQAESLARESPWWREMAALDRPSEAFEKLKADWLSNSAELAGARRLADKIAGTPPSSRDLELLRRVVARHPGDLRLLYQLSTAEKEARQDNDAAATALVLARRITSLMASGSK